MDFTTEQVYWMKGFASLAGADEAGRGPLAGPVFAAAVILPRNLDIVGIKDSKKLSAEKRADLYDQIKEKAESYFVANLSAKVIDQIGILNATKRAFRTAVKNLHPAPDFLLLDGLNINYPDVPQVQIIKGDAKVISIAAASILAKVERDRYMIKLHNRYPQYDFKSNKGYGTKEHLEAIKKYGPCSEHRKTFAPVNQYVDED